MMDELLKRVTEKTGLSPDQAKRAVETVLGFLKEKLPPQYATGLESLLAGGAPNLADGTEGLGAKATEALGGLFGKKG